MVKKEFIVAATPEQVKSAVNTIAVRHQKDMDLAEQEGEQTMKLLCRTGYTWGIIVFIQADTIDDGTTRLTITSTHNKEVFLTHQLQAEYEEKYVEKMQSLLPEYLEVTTNENDNNTAPKQNLKKRLGFLLSTLILLAFAVILITNYV